MPEWDPDITIDEALVRSLLAEQFPELDASSARLLGEGWDNSVWLVEERWAFRFPHREIAVPGVERELAVLPQLAPLLPVPIPVPTFVGRPGERFPWPFFGAPLLPGREPADVRLADSDRARLGVRFGRFLRVLHAPETRRTVDPDSRLPRDPNRRADMAYRVGMTRERLDRLGDLGREQRRAVDRILRAAETLTPSTTEVLVHGDLHVRHVLVEQRELSGVIDWGDVCVGDPAIDLLFVWSALPPDARNRFFEVYGSVDDEARLRARVLAIFLSAVLVLYARDQGQPALEREALAGLGRALVD